MDVPILMKKIYVIVLDGAVFPQKLFDFSSITYLNPRTIRMLKYS